TRRRPPPATSMPPIGLGFSTVMARGWLPTPPRRSAGCRRPPKAATRRRRSRLPRCMSAAAAPPAMRPPPIRGSTVPLPVPRPHRERRATAGDVRPDADIMRGAGSRRHLVVEGVVVELLGRREYDPAAGAGLGRRVGDRERRRRSLVGRARRDRHPDAFADEI